MGAGCFGQHEGPAPPHPALASFDAVLPPSSHTVAVLALNLTLEFGAREGVIALNYTTDLTSPYDVSLIDGQQATYQHWAVWPALPNLGTIALPGAPAPGMPGASSPPHSTYSYGGKVDHGGHFLIMIGYESAVPVPIRAIWANLTLQDAPRMDTKAGMFEFLRDDRMPSSPGEFAMVNGPARFHRTLLYQVGGSATLFLGLRVDAGTATVAITSPNGTIRVLQANPTNATPLNPIIYTLDEPLGPGRWSIDVEANWARGVFISSVAIDEHGPALASKQPSGTRTNL